MVVIASLRPLGTAFVAALQALSLPANAGRTADELSTPTWIQHLIEGRSVFSHRELPSSFRPLSAGGCFGCFLRLTDGRFRRKGVIQQAAAPGSAPGG